MNKNNKFDQTAFHNTIRGKVLLFIALMSFCIGAVFIYSFEQKSILEQKLSGIYELQQAQSLLLEADLAVFDAITQLVVLFEPAARKEVLIEVHQQFIGLTKHYENIAALYPERAPSFYSLLSSLAKVVMSPNSEDLRQVRLNLETHKSQLNTLILENKQAQTDLIFEYEKTSDRVAFRMVMLALTGMLFLVITASLFFSRVNKDVGKILKQIRDIVARKPSTLLKNTRDDEIGQLMFGINEMSLALDERDRQLQIEKLDKSHAESLGAIEHLTAGLVHEIGNPVAAISGMLSLIDYYGAQLPDDVKNNLATIGEYNQKLQIIKDDLAKIATPTSSQQTLIDVNELIEQIANVLNYDERWYGIEIELELASHLPALFGSSGQLKLLLSNLLNNSLEAKSQHKHTILIRTLLINNEIVLSIKDNGKGMDDATLAQAFNAFFTQKDPLQHSGLGLYSSLSIIEAHNGRINITSEQHKGTEVRVYFEQQATTAQHVTNEVATDV
ncbi:sensor histidine kinase [Thalassotalea aquiviva]|uniref:sensor histidine kinase n=1 Tax=Thalassotalea aquiviva TaxID=3242415 RepID=UPI00352A469C